MDTFIFKSATYDDSSQTILLGYSYENGPEFVEKIEFPDCRSDLNDQEKEALKQANLQQYSQQIDAISTEDSGYVATQQLLDKNLELDAIVCASDLIAIGVLRALRDRKIAIPKQIAVVGYDNIQVASFANPSLTTVEQNTKLAGEILVDSLLKLICGEKVEHYLMPVDVVVRQSCGTVK